MKRTKSLVTGASGFIRLNLVDQLIDKGEVVTCLVRETSKVDALQKRNVNLVYGDLADPATDWETVVSGQDVIYHLAGVTHAFEPELMFEVNANGLRRMLESCKKIQSPPVVIYVSSLAAAGPSQFDCPVSEDDPCQPVSDYGSSKFEAEGVVFDYRQTIPISIVRPPIVLGPRDSSGLTLFSSIADWGVHLIPGLQDKRFSIIHVTDLCAAMILIAKSGRRVAIDGDIEGIFYVAADETPTFSELGDLIGDALGKESVTKVRVPDFAVWTLGWINSLIGRVTGKPRLIDLDKAREGTAGSWTCSNQRIREQLGFKPACSLAERLSQTAKWYRDAGWIKPAPAARGKQKQLPSIPSSLEKSNHAHAS